MNPTTITMEKVHKLKDIGLQSMSFGMQSASERIRKIYARPESLSDIRDANRILNELRVPHHFDVIVDNPCETNEDIESTLKFLLSLKKPFIAKTFDLVHLPNTELTERLLRDKMITSEQVEGNFTYKDAIDWRVRESDVTMSTNDKYLVALIQMTGNVFFPNLLLKTLCASRRCFPEIFKRIFARIILTNWFYKNHVRLFLATSMARNRGVRVLFSKLVSKLTERFKIISRYVAIT